MENIKEITVDSSDEELNNYCVEKGIISLRSDNKYGIPTLRVNVDEFEVNKRFIDFIENYYPRFTNITPGANIELSDAEYENLFESFRKYIFDICPLPRALFMDMLLCIVD